MIILRTLINGSMIDMKIKLYYDINDYNYYNIIINNKIVNNKKLIEKQLLN